MKKYIKTYLKHILAVILFVVPFSFLKAQNWRNDLLEMNKAYMNASSFQMDIEVKSYTNSNDIKPTYNYSGKVASTTDNYYTSMMGKTTISNKQCVLVVDNLQKMIVYQKKKSNTKVKDGFSLANIDSAIVLMGKNVTIKYLVNNEKEKRIQITYKGSAIEKTELAINPADNTISEVVYYYNKEQKNAVAKVVISYANVELNKPINESFFSEDKYIFTKRDKIVPTKKYEKYQLINQSHL